MTLSDSGGHYSCLSNIHALEFFAYVAYISLDVIAHTSDIKWCVDTEGLVKVTDNHVHCKKW